MDQLINRVINNCTMLSKVDTGSTDHTKEIGKDSSTEDVNVRTVLREVEVKGVQQSVMHLVR